MYQVWTKYLERFKSYGVNTLSILIITKGHNSTNILQVYGFTVLVLWTLNDHGLHLNQVSWKYLERFQSYGADTISILIMTKGHNSTNIAHGVTVLVLLTLSNHGLHLYQVSWKYLKQFKNYGADTISILILTKGHKSVNIARGVTVLVLSTSTAHGLHLY